MIATLGLGVSFILWKLLMLVALGLMYLWIPAIGVFFSKDDDMTRSWRAAIMSIALLLCLPYWNTLIDSRVDRVIKEVLMETYENHLQDAVKPHRVVRTDLSTELRRFELIGWNPPKHFYVNLEDTQTHDVYHQVYVSKHCNASSGLRKGEEYNLRVTKYTLSNQPGKVFADFHNLYAAFC